MTRGKFGSCWTMVACCFLENSPAQPPPAYSTQIHCGGCRASTRDSQEQSFATFVQTSTLEQSAVTLLRQSARGRSFRPTVSSILTPQRCTTARCCLCHMVPVHLLARF